MTLTNSIAFWRPSIYPCEDSDSEPKLQINEMSIHIRAFAVAASAISFLSFAFLTWPASAILVPLIPGCVLLTTQTIATIETMRATRALNDIAIKLFINGNPVPWQAMQYIQRHPTAVQTLCKLPNVDLTKCNNRSGRTLLEEVVEQSRHLNILRDLTQKENISIFKMLLNKDHGDDRAQYKKLFNYFISQVTNTNELADYVILLLETKKVLPIDFNCNEQFQLWNDTVSKKFFSEKLVKSLINCGFDIDINNSAGITPLESAITNKDLEKIAFFLKSGATKPYIHTEIKVGAKAGMTWQEFLQEEPSIKEVFERNYCYNRTVKNYESKVFAIWKPAIDVNLNETIGDFKVNQDAIIIRIMFIASTFLSIALTLPLVPLLPVAFNIIVSFAASYLWNKYEYSRAISKLNALAIEEFKQPVIHRAVFDYVITQESAINQILAEGLDITKQDLQGKTLWSSLCSNQFRWKVPKFSTELSIFKKLADNIFIKNLSIEEKHAYFLDAIKSKHLAYAKYLLESGKIQINEFSEAQQFACLTSVDQQVTAKIDLLKKSGINLNARNEAGYTPLLFKLAASGRADYEFLSALLEAGADVNATVELKEEGAANTVVKNVRDFSKKLNRDEIERLLDRYPLNPR